MKQLALTVRADKVGWDRGLRFTREIRLHICWGLRIRVSCSNGRWAQARAGQESRLVQQCGDGGKGGSGDKSAAHVLQQLP